MKATWHHAGASERVGRRARWPVATSWAMHGYGITGIYIRLGSRALLVDWVDWGIRKERQRLADLDARLAAYERENA